MNPFQKLIAARLPQAAVALSGESASVVQLERRGGGLAVRSAGLLPLPEGLVRPSFDEPNVSDVQELAGAISELLTSAGLARRKRWSVGLPEASTRTSILTMETAPGSRAEADEMLRWKTERALGAPLDELRVSRERLRPDAQGRARHLVSAVRLTVLAEYEQVFAALGWHTGLVLPRHMGEAWWLMRDGGGASARAAYGASDSLLVSSHAEGFTAVILRGGAPLFVRGVVCETEDRADELYRFLLFYRDRTSPQAAEGDEAAPAAPPVAYGESIGRMLVAGTGIDEEQARAIVEETLSVPPRSVQPADLRLAFPSNDLDFRHIAAPAGLAALAWA
jgi:Tfp pilus assembly PilM family ATPase